MLSRHTLLSLLILLSLLANAVQAQNNGYYRYPAIHGDMVVFTPRVIYGRLDSGLLRQSV